MDSQKKALKGAS